MTDQSLFQGHEQSNTLFAQSREIATDATSLFALSRPTFYAAQTTWERAGIVGLLPESTGPRHAHKLTEELIAQLQPLARTMSPPQLALWVQEHYHLTVHPRSIERALARSAKKGGPS